MLTEIASFEKIRRTVEDPIWVNLENVISYCACVIPRKNIVNVVGDVVRTKVRGIIHNQIGLDLEC